jgi:hypothetical protein
MKRLNPKTDMPFKRGDLREDGLRFNCYSKSIKRKDGTFYEYWSKTIPKIRRPKNNILRTKIKKMLSKAFERSKRLNLEFSITFELIENKIKPGVCELTSLTFDLSKSVSTQNPFAPSIDRIDSSKGYTPENIRIVLWCVNRALGEDGIEKLKPVFKKLAEL